MKNDGSEMRRPITKKDILVALVLCCLGIAVAFYFQNNRTADSELRISIPDVISPQGKVLLQNVWPKIRKAAPGLDKYASVLTIAKIDDSLNSDLPGLDRLTVEIVVADQQGVVPVSYRARGHHCHLWIPKDGKTASVAKTPCKSLLLDREIQYDGGNDLVLTLQ